MRVLLGICLLLSAATAQDRLQIRTLDGEVLSGGTLSSHGPMMQLEREGAEPLELDLDDLETIAPGLPDADPSDGPAGRIWLRSGPSLAATVFGGSPRQLFVRLAMPTDRDGDGAGFELRHLAAFRVGPEQEDQAFERALAEPLLGEDLLFARNKNSGELTRLRVKVLGFEEGSVRVDYRGEKKLPLARVHGVVFGRDHGSAPEALGRPWLKLRLKSGTTLQGHIDHWWRDYCTLRLAEGPTLFVPLNSVRVAEVQSSRVARLSGAEPIEVLQVPAFDRLRPWLRDRAPGGPGLQLDGQLHQRGLCLIPRTELSFALEPGNFDRFDSLIGIDERSQNRRAHVVVRIRLDGEVALELADIGYGKTAVPVSLPLGEAKRLTLEVDFGRDFDLGDHCVFVDPRLVKS